MDRRRFWLVARKYATLAILELFLVIMFFLTDRFFTFRNITNVGRQVSLNAILSVGMTMVIISGGIDLSVGGIVALSACLCASIIKTTGNVALAIAVALVVGAVAGSFNGILTAKTGIAPFIITLSTGAICVGSTMAYTNAGPIPLNNPAFKMIGQGTVIGIPIPILIMLVVFVIAAYVMKRTKFGRYVYAIGGNENASRVAGVQVVRVKASVYLISGVLAAFTAVIYTSRLSSGVPSLGVGFEMQAITAAVIGGASLAGGQGSIWGTLIGAMIIGILNNALNLLNINTYYQNIATGMVVLLAVLFDRFIQTRVSSDS